MDDFDFDNEPTVEIPYTTLREQIAEGYDHRSGAAPTGSDRPTRDMRPLGLDLQFDLSDGVPNQVFDDERTDPFILVGAA